MWRTRRSLDRSASVTVKKYTPPSILARRYRGMTVGFHHAQALHGGQRRGNGRVKFGRRVRAFAHPTRPSPFSEPPPSARASSAEARSTAGLARGLTHSLPIDERP